jgi:N-methylhydantoinase A
VPGPVCYGAGGSEPTVTDACLVLGYLDPAYFLGGTMKLDSGAAAKAIADHVATPLGVSPHDAAAAILSVATENMVQAISEITVNQGIDPAQSVLIGGGGAAGLNAIFIARRLGCPTVIIPETGAGLSAAGALMSDLTSESRDTFFTTSNAFDREGVNRTLEALHRECQAFIDGPGSSAESSHVDYAVEARYASQVWEIEVPLPVERFTSDDGLDDLCEAFHAMHERIFAIRDPGSTVEFVSWTATARCQLRTSGRGRLVAGKQHDLSGTRTIFFAGEGEVEAALYDFETMPTGKTHHGPAIIESPFTTVVADARTEFERTASGSLVMRP